MEQKWTDRIEQIKSTDNMRQYNHIMMQRNTMSWFNYHMHRSVQYWHILTLSYTLNKSPLLYMCVCVCAGAGVLACLFVLLDCSLVSLLARLFVGLVFYLLASLLACFVRLFFCLLAPLFGCVFGFACLLACLLVCLPARLLACLLACWFVWLLLACSPARLFVWLFGLLACSLVCLLAGLFVGQKEMLTGKQAAFDCPGSFQVHPKRRSRFGCHPFLWHWCLGGWHHCDVGVPWAKKSETADSFIRIWPRCAGKDPICIIYIYICMIPLPISLTEWVRSCSL